MDRIKKEKLIEHPLETEFNIEPGTTVTEYHEVVPSEAIALPDYDDKDIEIEGRLEEIYAVAMSQVQVVADETERVEGRFKARMGEVTATMLNVALDAVRQKTDLKKHKDKMMLEKTSGGGSNARTVNNNLVVTADRNELLKMLMAAEGAPTVPQEKDVTNGEEQ